MLERVLHMCFENHLSVFFETIIKFLQKYLMTYVKIIFKNILPMFQQVFFRKNVISGVVVLAHFALPHLFYVRQNLWFKKTQDFFEEV